MKVLLIGPAPPPYGGMALQAQQLARLLQADGVQVTSLASNFALPSWLRWLDRIPAVRTAARAVLIWGRVWSEARRADVVHVMAASWLYFFAVVYPAVLVGRLCGARVVVNYRGGQAREFFNRYRRLVAPALRMADVVTAPSEFLAAVIRERFNLPVTVVPNILDTSLFQYRRRSRVHPRLLVTRHLEPVYDIESVLQAFRLIQQRHPEASLWIAGTGSEEPRLRQLAATWALRNLRFLGEIAHRDLPAIYDECDIYINASRVDNFPGALLEASAAGLVVVTTAAGGIPFVYLHRRSALLVEPGDWQGLAAAVEDVLSDQSQAAAMAETALSAVRACKWTEVRNSLFKAYGLSPQPLAVGEPSLDGIACAP